MVLKAALRLGCKALNQCFRQSFSSTVIELKMKWEASFLISVTLERGKLTSVSRFYRL